MMHLLSDEFIAPPPTSCRLTGGGLILACNYQRYGEPTAVAVEDAGQGYVAGMVTCH